MAVLEVGAGQRFERVADAIASAHDGDVVAIRAGTYAGDGAVIDKSLALVGVGGMARLVANGAPANGAILTTRADVDLTNLELAGAQGDGAAAVRHEAGRLVITSGFLHDNENHVVSDAGPQASVEIRNSELAGVLGGRSVTSGPIGRLEVSDSLLHDASAAPDIAAGARGVVVENNRIVGSGDSGSAIALSGTEHAVIRGNEIAQGRIAAGDGAIAFEDGGVPAGKGHLVVEANRIGIEGGGGAAVVNRTGSNASVVDNQLHDLGATSQGPASELGNSSEAGVLVVDETQPWRTDPWAVTQSDATLVAARELVDANLLDLIASQRDDGAAGGIVFDADGLAHSANVAAFHATGGDDQIEGARGVHGASYAGADGATQILLELAGPQDTGGSGVDRLQRIRDLNGSAQGDRLAGGSDGNLILGAAGDDHLTGGLGNDRLLGGPGNDVIAGGRGYDVLAGGPGADRFVVEALTEVRPQPLRDVIADFAPAEGDRIDLTAVDANTALPGDQAFAFVEAGPLGGTAGLLHRRPFADSTIVEGDVNGDGTPDVQVQLVGNHAVHDTDLWL